MKKFQTVDEYHECLSGPARIAVDKLRQAIRKAAPQAEETISYNMPAYKWNGILVWYAAFKKHIGFYPKAAAIVKFQSELGAYKCSKGAIQFPVDKPIPTELIKKIVRHRIEENASRKKVVS